MAWHRTSGNNGGKLEVLTASGDIASFETNLVAPYQSVTVNVVATGGNGTPDNPNPINGYTEANITRCGVNLFDKANVISGYCDYSSRLVYNNDFKSVVVPLINGAQYTFSQSLLGGFDRFAVCDSLEDNTTIYNPISPNISGLYAGAIPFTFTNSANKKYLICSVWRNTDTYTFDEIASTCQLEFGSTASEYHPYTGNTYTIAFGQTVYGGVLDVTRGKLTVTHGYLDLGSINWTKLNTTSPHWRFRGYVTGMKPSASPADIPNDKCDIYRTSSASDSWLGVNNIIAVANDANAFFIVDESHTTAEDFKSAVSGHYATYELTTPFDIDLTPEVISAVVGTNNVFADCGETEVEYLKRE